MKTRAQQWSARAFQHVTDVVEKTPSRVSTSEYRTWCRRMPGLIHQSGVLQALVFGAAKSSTGQHYVSDLAKTWTGRDTATYADLIREAQKADLQAYVALTRDVASIAHWHTRFAQVLLRDTDLDPEA